MLQLFDIVYVYVEIVLVYFFEVEFDCLFVVEVNVELCFVVYDVVSVVYFDVEVVCYYVDGECLS